MVKAILAISAVLFLLFTLGEEDAKEKEIYLMGLTITLTLLIAFTLLA